MQEASKAGIRGHCHGRAKPHDRANSGQKPPAGGGGGGTEARCLATLLVMPFSPSLILIYVCL